MIRGLILTAAAVLLAGCQPDPNDFEAAWYRSTVVRSCANGSVVTQDPLTHRLMWAQSGYNGHYGWVQDGITVDQVCS